MANSFDEEREPAEVETVAQLAANVVWRLPGCDDEAVRRALQSAFADFCRGSCALTAVRRVEVGPRDSVCELCVSPSREGRFVDCVKGVRKDSRDLVQGRDYSIRDGLVVFRHPFAGPCVLFVTTVEQPVDGSESAPSWFLKKYGRAIESGALARLMSMTGRAWSDPQQARMEAVSFNDHVTQAKLAYYNGGDMTNGSASAFVGRHDPGGLL